MNFVCEICLSRPFFLASFLELILYLEFFNFRGFFTTIMSRKFCSALLFNEDFNMLPFATSPKVSKPVFSAVLPISLMPWLPLGAIVLKNPLNMPLSHIPFALYSL